MILFYDSYANSISLADCGLTNIQNEKIIVYLILHNDNYILRDQLEIVRQKYLESHFIFFSKFHHGHGWLCLIPENIFPEGMIFFIANMNSTNYFRRTLFRKVFEIQFL